MSSNITILTTVVSLPNCLDFVHPDNAIITDRDRIPAIKANIPITLGKAKSDSLAPPKGPPGVVIITIGINSKNSYQKTGSG